MCICYHFLSSCAYGNQSADINNKHYDWEEYSSTDESIAISSDGSDKIDNSQTITLNKVDEKNMEYSASGNEYEKYYNTAEKAAKIITAIDRKNVKALVNVNLIDFTFDGIPELIVSYDTAGGHSYVENDVYDLQSDDFEILFSFRSSGITRDYSQSIFLYENSENENFYVFIYGLNSGNYLKYDYVDKLIFQNNIFSVSNLFSSIVSTDQTAYGNEFLYDGKPTDEMMFEQKRSEWFSDLHEQQFCCVQVSIEADDWDNYETLKNSFINALGDFDNVMH